MISNALLTNGSTALSEAPRSRVTAAAVCRSEEIRISRRAQKRGFHSLDALKLAVLQQRSIWWQGKSYHCGLCNLDFVEAQSAAEHVVGEQHPVLRMDTGD